MCVGIIRNNSLVGGRSRAESNPGHWARHALLHMAAECVNHSDVHVVEEKIFERRPQRNAIYSIHIKHKCNAGVAVSFATYTAPVPSARLGMIGTSSSVPRHYPGTLFPAGSQRSQNIYVRVSWRRSRLWFKTANYRWWKGGRARQRDTLRRVV